MAQGTYDEPTGPFATPDRDSPTDDGAPVTEQAMRWAPGIGALAVVVGLLAVLGLVWFDRSLDRVSVDDLAEDGETERSSGDETAASGDEDVDGDGGDGGDGQAESGVPRQLGTTLHVLVTGSDDRSVLSPEERRELHTGDAIGARSEAIALVRIDPDRDRVDVLRFPRDLLVTRCDGSRGRINAAYVIGERDGMGGASCLVQTIGAWTDIPIHHVVRVDFAGFVDAVDAVGGVDVWVAEPLQDDHAGLDVPAGCVHLDGAEALAFVRARHLDNDFGRIQRQQALVAATMDQVLTADTLRDPRRLGRLLVIARRSLEFDDHLSAHRMRSIAATVAGLDGDDLVTRTVDGEIRRSEGGISFLHPDEEHAETLFEAFVEGELASTARSSADDPDEAAGIADEDAAITPDLDTDDGGSDGAVGNDTSDGETSDGDGGDGEDPAARTGPGGEAC